MDEIYHPGYVAKRMEIGAVVGATPASHVRRECPAPGDVIVLERDENGNPLLRVRKGMGGDGKLRPQVYSEKNEEAIPPIPPNIIEPFISQPLVIEANELDGAARIVATQQDRVFLGEGSVAYVDDADPKQEKWQVYRNGKPLHDPADDTRILGYEAFYLGTATQTRPGQPATFEITSATQEIGRGDRLIPASRPTPAPSATRRSAAMTCQTCGPGRSRTRTLRGTT